MSKADVEHGIEIHEVRAVGHHHDPTKEEYAMQSRALEELDERGFDWGTMKIIAIAGCGFVADQYNLFAVSLVKPILDVLYPDPNASQAAALMGAAGVLGCVVGQVFFGYLGDRFGRKNVCVVTMLIIIACTIGTLFASPMLAGLSIYAVFGIWQLMLGVGIGGDYPMAATISGEFASTKTRGMVMNLVFSGQGIGRVYCGIVALIFCAAFKSKIQADKNALDSVWRLIIVFGLLPSFFALYSRLRMEESPRYKMEVEGDYAGALKTAHNLHHSGETTSPVTTTVTTVVTTITEEPKSSLQEFRAYFAEWKNMKKLVGCAGTWFVNDVAVYGLGVNASFILSTIGFGNETQVYDKIFNTILGNFYLLFFGFLPGYYVSAFTIDRWGRRTIQLWGFAFLTVIYIILSAAHKPLSNSSAGSIILYVLGQFFQNFGPNSTTFLLSAELFPTKFRSTAHGISAAVGKLGAVIASYGIALLIKPGSLGVPGTIGLLAAFMGIGWVITYFCIPETKGKRLEDIE
ncbi:Inorganic phosphate transporter pho84 [Rhizophlyctis rosea]|nr:Inorganic phosphate transporter pho84 [Rhizophlyctis rosea]